ncbi:phosphoketolase [Fomitiporia mediterranea MF3/22]|uniref:phosphoketolase n=1 Tax=Fomitiporia mediterranea (strain MF3/22) TaxID=694068 RepID=UPI00044074C3|nr:phosphoketolase [Fomitiporia mediterranea MF3/22]EJD06948.1 phosphoketolase [Fomitiporia mediterranea MF3/22]
MPAQLLTQPNPPPEKSLLPKEFGALSVKLDLNVLSQEELNDVKAFRRAADYIAAAMIFLKDNVLVERKITFDDIKPRLLGHWGTCPGLSLIYAHLNRLITKHDVDMLYVVGPGHGAPGILSCLWLEDSLSTFIPKYSRDKEGLGRLISGFSTPSGFPSHINAETPGSIHEGGELGYALSVAFGAVMDQPDLVVACVVGDGEAETGPTATAWHSYKYIDPAESGAVIPIVHVNGFKISERTIYGTMDDLELCALFSGYGYQVRFVEDLENIDQDMAASLEWALAEIRKIQKAARSGQPIVKPRWPVLILRSPKGWSGPKAFHGEYIEGSFHAHQVPLPNAKKDKEELEALQKWLDSYKITEVIDAATGCPLDHILHIVPPAPGKRLGQRKEANGDYSPLITPDWQKLAVKKGTQESCMQRIGKFLLEVVKENPKTFRIFSPDELVSNKLDAVFEATGRNFQWDENARASGGRIIEILSEHTCQGMMQGYTLTGRTALFPSYEAFLGIVHTMMVQYAKFVKMAHETTWRKDVGSINYVETSTWTRQEHNGFSHQNPSFIGAVLNLKPQLARVYLPPDANCFLSTVSHCLRAKNYVNLMVGSKQPTPVWLSPEEANAHCIAGASIWKFASTDSGVDPDVVLVGIGVELTFEVIAAAAILRKEVPELRVRVVNVTDLMILGPERSHPHALQDADFISLFTAEKRVHFNYHGYPGELRGLLFGRPNAGRMSIEGYSEEGTTTTPFDMMLSNGVSRYHVAAAAVRGGALVNEKVAIDAQKRVSDFMHRAQKAREYAKQHGQDAEDTYDTPKFE